MFKWRKIGQQVDIAFVFETMLINQNTILHFHQELLLPGQKTSFIILQMNTMKPTKLETDNCCLL